MTKKFHSLTMVLFVLLSACQGLTPGSEDSSDDSQEQVINEENIDDAIAANAGDHDDQADYTWDESSLVYITLNGSSVSVSSDKVSVSGSTVTINSSGNFSISGSLSNGQIIVNTEDEEIVRLILDGVDINSSSSAPIYVKSAEKVLVYLVENTSNKLSDGSSYNYDDAEEEEPNSTLFSKSDLTLAGDGSLTIDANFNDAINTKDGLIIAGGSYSITSVDDGIRGKDYTIVKSGTFQITAQGDGIKSDNDNDETKGYINIANGNFEITAVGDGISAETDLLISYAEMTLKTTGSTTSSSAKGLKAGANEIIDDGIYSMNCTDDAIHSDGTITINGGSYEISSSDDGIHSDYDLVINDGNIDIVKSYEGIECYKGNMAINEGTIHIKSSDDALNLSAGGDSMGGQGGWGGSSSSSGSYYMYINGGRIYMNASGDGLDSNGSALMTGGTVLIDGPTNSGNGAIDVNGSFNITGGTIIAAGSSGMAEAPESSNSQYSVLVRFSSSKSAGTLFHVETTDGEEILTYKPAKVYQSVAFSTPTLSKGETYNIYTGGSDTGTETDGLYSGGTYSGGSLFTSFNISAIVTDI